MLIKNTISIPPPPSSAGAAYVDTSKPRFLEPIPNKTVVVGRDVILPCSVDNLKGYKVSYKGCNRYRVKYYRATR